MTKLTIPEGIPQVHKIPSDLKKVLLSDLQALSKWEDITSLAHNEWICWVEFAKKPETREDHIRRVVSELKEGMRRPCCWIGCIHRKDKPMSNSQKYILRARS